MRFLKGSLVIEALLPTLGAAAQLSSIQEAIPPGIELRLTREGPAFVDSRGMTLYRSADLDGSYKCENRHYDMLQFRSNLEGTVDFAVKAPDSQRRRTCLDKHPPLSASADSR